MEMIQTNSSAQPSSEVINLQAWEEKFLARLKEQGKSFNTLKNYRTDLTCFNEFMIKFQNSLEITEFGDPQVMAYRDFLEKKYTSDNSQRRRVQTLRLFFDYLVAHNLLPENSVRKMPTSPKFLDIPRPTEFKVIKKIWDDLLINATPAEMKELAENSKTSPAQHQIRTHLPRLVALRNQLLICLVYYGGLKVSSLGQLLNSDIMMSRDAQDHLDLRVLVRPEKRDAYSVPMPTWVYSIYESYQKLLNELKVVQGIDFEELFFNANPYKILSGGLSDRGLEIIFEEWSHKYGTKITAKNLRQSCIVKWLKDGHKDSMIREWIGVIPSYSFKPYWEIIKEDNEKGAERLFLPELAYN